MRLHRFSQCLAAIGALAWAGPAAADGLALSRFDPAPAGDRFFSVQSPYAAGSGTPHLMLLGEYANNPLVLRGPGDEKIGAVVGSQLWLHLNGGISLWDRLNLNVDVPVAVLQGGDSPAGTYASPEKAQFGDVRVGARVRLLGEYFDAFQLAVGGYVWLPTGASGSFVSDKKLRGMPQLIAGGRTDRIVWTVAAGPELRAAQDYGGTPQGTMVKIGGGVGFLLDEARNLQVGPEVNVALNTDDVQKRTTNAEALVGARYRFLRDIEVGLAAGPGLTSGIGTPDFRAVFMAAFTPEQVRGPLDRDGDGILDRDDACADTPGVASTDSSKHGCPLPPDRDGDGILDSDDACADTPGIESDDPAKHGCPDRDGDGIIDSADACADEPGVTNDDPAKNGCPADRDGDGVPDAADACIDIPGVKTADAATNGCPADTDGDGIRDDVDACPNEKGKANEDPAKHGCPVAVRVTETEIKILQQVQFDTGKATIKKVSHSLIEEVAGVLKDHPEIVKLEVQGHTDNVGNAKLNQKLSQDRAASVRKALVERGIAEDRLDSKGYGQDKPIDDNKTAAGRQNNRRVQFVILEKAPKGGNDAK